MERILITVSGPNRSVETAVPAAEPVGLLLPSLVELCEGRQLDEDSLEGWTLLTDQGWPLPVESSLSQFGVAEGSTLRLAPPGVMPETRPPAPPEPVPASVAAAAEPSTAELPTALGVGERIRLAVDAALSPTTGFPVDTEAPPASTERLSVHPDASPIERARRAWEESDYRRRLDQLISAPRLNRCVKIAVVSPKGGVGKTTIASMLGTLLAQVRNDRVVAVDGDPDYGTLGDVLGASGAVQVDELLQVLEQPALTVSMLDRCLGRGPHGLMVLPAPTDPDRMETLDGEAYSRVIRRLEDLVGILVIDCGPGVLSPPVRAALSAADQVVLVTDSDPATASLVARAALRMPKGKDFVIVVNKVSRNRPGINLENLREDVRNARMLLQVERDRGAAARLQHGRFDWHTAPDSWQIEVRELAASLVGGWDPLGISG